MIMVMCGSERKRNGWRKRRKKLQFLGELKNMSIFYFVSGSQLIIFFLQAANACIRRLKKGQGDDGLFCFETPGSTPVKHVLRLLDLEL